MQLEDNLQAFKTTVLKETFLENGIISHRKVSGIIDFISDFQLEPSYASVKVRC